MKRVLLPNGKFAPYREIAKKSKAQTVKSVSPKKETKEAPNGASSPSPSDEGQAPAPKKFKLTGEETAAELKAMLDEVGVSYAKNAGAPKCLELIAPYLEEEEDSTSDDL